MRFRSTAIRPRVKRYSSWIAILSLTVAILFVGGFAVYLLTEWPRIATDPAFFQHAGWYILEGGVPYVDIWDVNPPVPFAVTATLAAVSGGNLLVLHGLSVSLTVLVAAASVLLIGWVAYLVTGEDTAAIAAGFTMLVVPELFVLPLLGVRSQFYALFFGALALALALRDRPFLAGIAAALSAGSWQSGAVFAPLIVGMAYQRNGGKGALKAIGGGGVVTGIVVVVFAAAGALVSMIVQTIVAPLTAGSPYTLAERGYTILLVFGYGSLLFPVALFGWAHAAVRDRRRLWWVPTGGLILALQMLFVDMDGATDVFLWLTFVAIGVSLAVNLVIAPRSDPTDRHDHDPTWTDRNRWLVVAIVCVGGLLVLSGLVWNTGSPSLKSTLVSMEQDVEPETEAPSVTPAEADVPAMRTIYWEQMKPKTCHYRLSWNEARWIAMTDDRLDRRTCDGWPSRTDHT